MLPPPYRLKSVRLVLSFLLTVSLLAAWLTLGDRVQTVSAQLPPPPFRNFESPQVHPLAMTPDGTRLLAVNSPNATLSVFQLTGGTPTLTAEIPVGLEPVSVAARNDREAWVVNWLSDSVSVVDLSTGNVVRTIDVGDEPTDVLFAGPGGSQAFVCVSGLNQVRVFDAGAPDSPPQTVNVFGKQPRSLARDAAGANVFVSVFESGNQTTVIPESVTRVNGGLPPPVPAMRQGLPPAPNTGLIVKWNGSQWADETGDTKWDQFVTYTLADIDLVVIDASTPTPSVGTQVRGLGTHLGNMAFDASGGRLFVTNIDSTSVMRFEPNLRGRFQHTRVSVLDVTPGGAASLAATNDLNPQVDFNNPNGTDAERTLLGLAMPADLARSSDGTLYVAATSSARVGVLSPAGALQDRISVGQGPTGLAVDDPRQRLYVLNRFDQTLSVVDTNSKTQVSTVAVGFNPEPAVVRNGRRFLYDASFSSHGTVSCASCHFSGHRDGLAWDLGDPTGVVVNPNASHHPMKGPMTTQSLRDIIGVEPLHWRGDRRNLSEFNPAFTGLLGSPRLLTPQEMAAFEAFVRTLVYPPNPNENLNRTFPNPPTGPSALRGVNTFQTATLTGISCNTCHQTFPGFRPGTDRFVFPGSILQEPQNFKVPQLRGMYQKTGLQKPPAGAPRTEQITGFGFLHDGSFDTLLNFLRMPVFAGFANDNARRDVEAFMLAFDTGTAPAVGLQMTVNAANKSAPETLNRLNLLVQQSEGVAPNCNLIVKGIYGGVPRGFQHVGSGQFQPDTLSEPLVTLQQLIEAAGDGAELTFTGVPPNSGRRMGIDRDGDNLLDDDEPRTSVSVGGRVVDASGVGVAGVPVLLSGTQTAVTQTDASGRYVFNFVSTAGVHTVTPQGSGQTFTPQSRSFVNPTWNASATFITSPAQASDVSSFFVTQHYNDFLNREPDAEGLAHWTNEIEQCGANTDCRNLKRQNVSAAFFLSIEFKETGFLVYRSYKASFDDLPDKPVPVTFRQLMTDTQRIGRGFIVGVGDWAARIEANKTAFFRGWVQRPEFLARFPVTMAPADFVNALNANADSPLTPDEVNQLVAELSSNNSTVGRAAAVRRVAENAAFERNELNKAFVLMQYFGYMRRDPDSLPDEDFRGYGFWLTKLNDAQGNFINAQMVESFITSIEYRQRFGPQ